MPGRLADRSSSSSDESGYSASTFWNVLWAVTKCHPDGAWIKSMFDNPNENEDGNYDTISVQLFNKSDGTNDPAKAPLQSINVTDLLTQLTNNGATPWNPPVSVTDIADVLLTLLLARY